jgi:hypothetical protein
VRRLAPARRRPRERADPGVAGFLIARHPGLYAVDELVALFSSPEQDVGQERFELEEGIRQLVGDGLAHQLRRFVWASHAAVSSERRLRA